MNNTTWTEQTGPASVLRTLRRGDWLRTAVIAERSGVKRCTVNPTLCRLRDMELIVERGVGRGAKEWRIAL
jgi:hypothetical protein